MAQTKALQGYDLRNKQRQIFYFGLRKQLLIFSHSATVSDISVIWSWFVVILVLGKEGRKDQIQGFFSIEGMVSFIVFFFSMQVFFHEHSRITGLQEKGECISLTPHYHFYPLHRHLDISWAITTESSPLCLVSSRTRTGNLWFPSASR